MHRVEHLLEVVDLLGYFVLVLLLLGDNAHKKGYVVAEAFAYVLDGVVGVLDHVVQKGCDDGVGAKLQLHGYDAGNGYGVQNVWLAGLALLVVVSGFGKA